MPAGATQFDVYQLLRTERIILPGPRVAYQTANHTYP